MSHALHAELRGNLPRDADPEALEPSTLPTRTGPLASGEIAITEIFNNAVEYGSQSPRDTVTVTCELLPDRMILKVKDCGKREVNFPSLLKRAERVKPVDDLEQRGRGLFLIKRLSDELVIDSDPETGTEVTVTKLK